MAARPILQLAVLVALITVIATDDIPTEKASQCFKSRGIPKVQFKCIADHMIKIDRAFHGIKVAQRPANHWESNSACEQLKSGQEANCSYCSGDCMDDSMNLVYDWSTCMGNQSCTRTVMQSYMPTCKGTNKKFSDYLQVEYKCVPKNNVYDICQHLETSLHNGFIQSPNYPNNYPTKQDCICKLSTQWNSRIVLSLVDLLLETKNSRCRADWMMLRQNNQKHRHCGAIMTGVKNITSTGNALAIQFHSDGYDNRTQKFQYFTRSLKGFWMAFTAEPRAAIRVHCRRLSSADPEVQEISKDDAEYDEILSTSALETTTAMTTETNEVDGGEGGRGGGRRPGKDNHRRKNGPKWKHPLAETGGHGGGNPQDSGASKSAVNILITSFMMCLGHAIRHL